MVLHYFQYLPTLIKFKIQIWNCDTNEWNCGQTYEIVTQRMKLWKTNEIVTKLMKLWQNWWKLMETRFSILCIAVNEYHTYKLFCEMYLNKIDKLFYYWINHQRRLTFFNKLILFDYLVIILATTLILFEPVFCEKHFLYHNHKLNVRVFYQPGVSHLEKFHY